MFRRMTIPDYGLPPNIAKELGRKDLATSETGKQMIAKRTRNSRLAKAGIGLAVIAGVYFRGLGHWNEATKACATEFRELVTRAPVAKHNDNIFTEEGHTYQFRRFHLAREGLEYAVSHSTGVSIPKLGTTDLVYRTMKRNHLTGAGDTDILKEGAYWLPVPVRR